MNDLQVFKNEKFGQVRGLSIGGELWMVGKDVAEALGYSNSRDALAKHVDSEDKGVAKCDTLGGVQDFAIINESGLYSLILSSKLEKAKEFKRWVTSDVLPSIRKTGAYTTAKNLKAHNEEMRNKARLLEAENKARALALREDDQTWRKTREFMRGITRRGTAQEKLALIATYRKTVYDDPKLDIVEQAYIREIERRDSGKQHRGIAMNAMNESEYSEKRFNALMEKIASAGIRKSIHLKDYVVVPTRTGREIADRESVPYERFLRWAADNGYIRIGTDGKNTVAMRLKGAKKAG